MSSDLLALSIYKYISNTLSWQCLQWVTECYIELKKKIYRLVGLKKKSK